MKLLLFLLCLFVADTVFAQKQDTLKCRAMFSEPWSTAKNKKVRVGKFYVILKDGKPIKFLQRNKRWDADVDIWSYKIEGEGILPKD